MAGCSPIGRPDFESENVEIREAIGEVSEKTRKRGIWVMDRGGDRGYLYRYLLHEDLRFIIRAEKRPDGADGPETSPSWRRPQSCPMLFHEYIAKERRARKSRCQSGGRVRRVRFPDHRGRADSWSW